MLKCLSGTTTVYMHYAWTKLHYYYYYFFWKTKVIFEAECYAIQVIVNNTVIDDFKALTETSIVAHTYTSIAI